MGICHGLLFVWSTLAVKRVHMLVKEVSGVLMIFSGKSQIGFCIWSCSHTEHGICQSGVPAVMIVQYALGGTIQVQDDCKTSSCPKNEQACASLRASHAGVTCLWFLPTSPSQQTQKSCSWILAFQSMVQETANPALGRLDPSTCTGINFAC